MSSIVRHSSSCRTVYLVSSTDFGVNISICLRGNNVGVFTLVYEIRKIYDFMVHIYEKVDLLTNLPEHQHSLSHVCLLAMKMI